MDDPVARLKAGLDADEAVARKAVPWPFGPVDSALGIPGPNPGYVWAHVGRQDPARTLREVAAKREILAWYEDAIDASSLFREKLGTGTHMAVAAESYLNVIRALAAVYGDDDT